MSELLRYPASPEVPNSYYDRQTAFEQIGDFTLKIVIGHALFAGLVAPESAPASSVLMNNDIQGYQETIAALSDTVALADRVKQR